LERRDDAVKNVVERICRNRERHLPRFDLREIEHVVDQPQQMLAVRLHAFQYLADLIRHLAIDVVEHQFGIAKDGVERRAQLMADISEELRFVLARDFELAALLVDLGEEAGIVDGERRLRRKGLEQLDNGRGKGAGCAAPDDKRADDTIAAKERHHQQRPEARLEDELLEREMRRFEEIGNLGRLARWWCRRAPPDGG